MAPSPSNADRVTAAAQLIQRRPSANLQRRRGPRAGVDQFDEIGTTGLRQYGGYVVEEWLADLQGRKAAWVYREMADNNPVIGAILFAVEMLARKVEYRVQDGRPEHAEFVESCMHDMSHTWGDFVSEALSMLPYGWALHEEVFKRREGNRPRSQAQLAEGTPESKEDTSEEPASSQYKDGKIGWRKLPIRAQETLLKWHFDGYSGLRAMEQLDWHGGHNTIPITKALLFRTRTTRGNPEGYSILRKAYTSYYALKNIQAIEAIGIERDLAGIPKAKAPDGVDIFSPSQKDLLEAVQEMVRSIRRDEDEGIVLPSGWELELLTTGGSRQIDTDAVIRRYEQRIASSCLADFILIGQDSVGSYAMVDVKSDLFGLAVDGVLDLICEVLNRYAIPRLLALNGMTAEELPRIEHSSSGRIDLEKVGNFLYQLKGAGAPIPWSRELIEQLFGEAGLPASFETDEPIETEEEPTGSAHLLSEGEEPAANQPEPKPTEEDIEKADADIDPRSGMISLDLPPGTIKPVENGVKDHHITVVYLGKDVDDQAFSQAVELARSAASKMAPLSGTVGGLGTFSPSASSDGKTPVYTTPNVDGLDHLRRALEPLHASEHRDFKPHITLTYLDEGEQIPPTVPETAVRFTHLSVHRGGEVVRIPFTGAPLTKAEGETQQQEEERFASELERLSTTAATAPVAGYGTAILVGPVLASRLTFLALHLEKQILSALAELGIVAATAYLTVAGAKRLARKRDRQQLANRVLKQIGLKEWLERRLQPILENQAVRVIQDTERVLSQQTGEQVHIPEIVVRRLTEGATRRLKLKPDLERGVKEAIMRAIEEGLDAGENPTVTAKRIEKLVPAGRFVNAGPEYRARLIAREETAELQRLASLSAYENMRNITAIQLQDGIYGPPRSDSECMDRDGEIVPISQARTVKPNHPQCTLGYMPVVSSLPPALEREPALAAA